MGHQRSSWIHFVYVFSLFKRRRCFILRIQLLHSCYYGWRMARMPVKQVIDTIIVFVVAVVISCRDIMRRIPIQQLRCLQSTASACHLQVFCSGHHRHQKGWWTNYHGILVEIPSKIILLRFLKIFDGTSYGRRLANTGRRGRPAGYGWALPQR